MTGRIRGLPLRVKLVVALLTLVIAALSTAGVAAVTTLRGYLVGRVDAQLERISDQSVRLVQFGAPLDPPPGNEPHRLGPPSEYRVYVSDASGQTRWEFSNPIDSGQSAPQLPDLTVNDAEAKSGDPFTVGSTGDGSDWRVLARTLSDNSRIVYVATQLGEVSSTVDRLVYLEVSIGGVVVVLLGGLGYFLVRRSLRPLTEIERTAAAIAGGDLSCRVPHHPERTEVGRLAGALNGMLAQIETAFRVRESSEAAARDTAERMRRFAADASHELRTPLTSIRGFAELYRQGAATDPDDIARFMRRIESESARMGLLVDDLLLLARLDQERPLERAPVHLATLAADAVHDAQVVAPDRPITLSVEDGVAPVVLGDEARLRQVVANLVSNALTHTPAGSPVRVEVSVRDHRTHRLAVLSVVDRGPGLSEADACRVFERFYRADPSRTRRSGGSGLGLSIVSALAAAHGGTVELDTRPGEGATFRIVLPLLPTAARE